jgi:hypothetical protein
MDRNVETQKFDESGVVAEAEEGGEVVGIILCWVDTGKFRAAEDVAIDATGNVGQFRNPRTACKRAAELMTERKDSQVHGILECGPPVLLLRHTFLVAFRKSGIVI